MKYARNAFIAYGSSNQDAIILLLNGVAQVGLIDIDLCIQASYSSDPQTLRKIFTQIDTTLDEVSENYQKHKVANVQNDQQFLIDAMILCGRRQSTTGLPVGE